MTVEVQVGTTAQVAEIRHVADLLRQADRDMDKELVGGIRRAVATLGPEIRQGIPTYMPSGYTPVLEGALVVSPSVRRVRGPGVSLRVWGRGKEEQRDVKALNDGRLRHPVYGRWRRLSDGKWTKNPWRMTTVHAGFVTDPFDRRKDAVVREMGRVLEGVANKIARG